MPPSEEKIAEIDFNGSELPVEEMDVSEVDHDENKPREESSEFALKMINSVKAMNNGEVSHYEMVNSFSLVGLIL